MKLQPHASASQNMFTARGPGYVMVSGKRYEYPIVVTPYQVTDWAVQDFASLDESHFAQFLDFHPEILILGTGSKLQFPHPRLYRHLIAAHIGVECMDTAAACRTYNILMSEGRKVVAAILLL